MRHGAPSRSVPSLSVSLTKIPPPRRREFHGIGQQIVDYLLHLRRVEPHHAVAELVLEFEREILALHRITEIHENGFGELRDVVSDEAQFFASHFQLAEIQQMVDQRQQLLRVVVHALELGQQRRVLRPADDALERQDDKRKRRAQLVGDVDEESEFHLVQLLALLLHFERPAVFAAPPHAPPKIERGEVSRQNEQQGVEYAGRCAAPERRVDGDVQFGAFAAPVVVVVGRQDAENVVAWLQEGVGGASDVAGADFGPLAVEILEYVAVGRVRRVGVVEARKFERQERFVVSEVDAVDMLEVGVEYAAAVVFGADVDLLPENLERRNQGAYAVVALVEFRRRDFADAVGSSEIDVAAGVGDERFLEKGAGRHSVFGPERRDGERYALLRVDGLYARDMAEGGDPYVADAVGRQTQYVVVRQPVLHRHAVAAPRPGVGDGHAVGGGYPQHAVAVDERLVARSVAVGRAEIGVDAVLGRRIEEPAVVAHAQQPSVAVVADVADDHEAVEFRMFVAQHVDMSAFDVEAPYAAVDRNPERAVLLLVKRAHAVEIGRGIVVRYVYGRHLGVDVVVDAAAVDAECPVVERAEPYAVVRIAEKADAEFVAQPGVGYGYGVVFGIVAHEPVDRADQNRAVAVLDHALDALVGHFAAGERTVVDGVQTDDVAVPVEKALGQSGYPDAAARVDVYLRDVGVVVDARPVGLLQPWKRAGLHRRTVDYRNARTGRADPQVVVGVDGYRGVDVVPAERNGAGACGLSGRRVEQYEVAVEHYPQIAFRGAYHVHARGSAASRNGYARLAAERTHRGVVFGQSAVEREHPYRFSDLRHDDRRVHAFQGADIFGGVR